MGPRCAPHSKEGTYRFMKRFGKILAGIFNYYNTYRIPRAAAALSYYLTMTFFPLIICLYSLLGQNYMRVTQTLNFISQFISAKTAEMLRSFLAHVALSHNSGMFYAGLLVFITSASAAERTLQGTIGEMQGKQHFQGLADLLFSIVYALVFVAAIYFSIVVLFTGRDILDLINGYLPFVDISVSWTWLRYLLLAGISFFLFWAIYAVAQAKGARYRSFPGALFTTVGIVVISVVFSNFIAVSTRYSLVYGSLASVILLMFFLFLNCQIIYLGAAVNLALRDEFGTGHEEKKNA